MTSQEKMAPLIRFFGKDLLSQVEFVNADLLDERSIESAVAGCDYVVHTASPVAFASPKDHDDLIVPAVNGVKYVMRAAQKHRTKRVVITSSIASVYRLPEDKRPEVFTEENWSDLEYSAGSAYIKSKTIAEKYAWDFQKAMSAIGQYCPEIATICPSLVLGEAITAGATTSTAIISGLINGKTTRIPNISF